MRTAPSTLPARVTGTAVARIRASKVSESRWTWTTRPFNAAAISARVEKSSPTPRGELSAITVPSASTITTRPRTSRADDAASSDAEAPPDTSAATTSACPSACVSTSAFTRSRTLRTRGTSIDPIASTST